MNFKISEVEQIVNQLQHGSVVKKFYLRKPPQIRTLSVRRETRQLAWYRSGGDTSRALEVQLCAGMSSSTLLKSTASSIKGNVSLISPHLQVLCEGTVDISEIRLVRRGKTSKDFERWAQEGKRHDPSTCIVILYGKEFKMKTLSFATLSAQEADLWMKCLSFLISEHTNLSYPTQLNTWLTKEFYRMENIRGNIGLKEFKSFLPRVNCKMSTSKLRDVFQSADRTKSGEIGYDDFSSLFHELVYDRSLFQEYFAEKYTSLQNRNLVGTTEFSKFLHVEQHENNQETGGVIRAYLQDPLREVQNPELTIAEFLDYLYSKHNEIWDPMNSTVNQDMNRPLSHYWIASSHNTYLTGDQFSSESSVDAYTRCLLWGCRCLELDCWDGQDGYPVIFHGRTLTSKIKFVDVLQAIRNYAFATSDYPVILSLEDHCSLPQQRIMAQKFIEIFGDMLVTQPVDKQEQALPSPEQLKRRIILKHKKLPEDSTTPTVEDVPEDFTKEMDLSNTTKNGAMWLKDDSGAMWVPHFFVLTTTHLLYTELTQEEERSDEANAINEDGETDSSDKKTSVEELHFEEKWFHGKLKGGRRAANELIQQYAAQLGEGCFLVRESENFVGDFTISFWRKGRVHHILIQSKYELGLPKYSLVDTTTFDSLFNLITHYRANAIKGLEFQVKLGEPVPQPMCHEKMPWFLPNMDRSGSEDLLKKVPVDGAYLVRPVNHSGARFAISFRFQREIKHCIVKEEGRLFTIGASKFENLVELISFYEKHPFYKKTRLTQMVNEEVVQSIGKFDGYNGYNVYLHADYLDTSYVLGQHEDNESEDSRYDLGSLQKGSVEMTINASVDLVRNYEGMSYAIRVCTNKNTPSIILGLKRDQEQEAREWCKAIKDTVKNASDKENRNKIIEQLNMIAKELSSLIVYCCSVNKFNLERAKTRGKVYYEMYSFQETIAEKLMCGVEKPFFLHHHQIQLSRVYPKGQRLDSSNYNPIPLWNAAVHMVALNYQTPDKAMQLNHAKFRQNGGCGYVLRPQFMFPSEEDTCQHAKDVSPIKISIVILGGRHLNKSGRGIVSPFVEVEVIGQAITESRRTKTISDNGLNPYWNEVFEFQVLCPELAMLRFVVQDEDVFGDPNFIGQACYPVGCLRQGYRSVPLLNGYSEEIPLSSLLVHLRIKRETSPSSLQSF